MKMIEPDARRTMLCSPPVLGHVVLARCNTGVGFDEKMGSASGVGPVRVPLGSGLASVLGAGGGLLRHLPCRSRRVGQSRGEAAQVLAGLQYVSRQSDGRRAQ